MEWITVHYRDQRNDALCFAITREMMPSALPTCVQVPYPGPPLPQNPSWSTAFAQRFQDFQQSPSELSRSLRKPTDHHGFLHMPLLLWLRLFIILRFRCLYRRSTYSDPWCPYCSYKLKQTKNIQKDIGANSSAIQSRTDTKKVFRDQNSSILHLQLHVGLGFL